MKAISLWEPWATAIAIGTKQIETRGWPTSYRGPLAIHAAKTRAHCEWVFRPTTLDEIIVSEEFWKLGIRCMDDLRFGCVVATCELTACWRTEHARGGITPMERALGNYGDGRFAWKLSNVVRLREPIPARGAQQFWEWDNGEPSPQANLL